MRRPPELRVLKSTRDGIAVEVFLSARSRLARAWADPLFRVVRVMDLQAQKRALRQVMVARILAMNPDDRQRQEAVLAERLAVLPGFEVAATVLLYATAFPEEIPTGPMLRQALRLGKRLVCPRVDRRERRLRLYHVEDLETDFVPGMLGIPEPRRERPEIPPERIDWVLVPGLAFDPRGFRLGRGAGHYDRLLPTLRPDTPRWALALDTQWVDALPVEPHDQPLDGIASPGKTLADLPRIPQVF